MYNVRSALQGSWTPSSDRSLHLSLPWLYKCFAMFLDSVLPQNHPVHPTHIHPHSTTKQQNIWVSPKTNHIHITKSVFLNHPNQHPLQTSNHPHRQSKRRTQDANLEASSLASPGRLIHIPILILILILATIPSLIILTRRLRPRRARRADCNPQSKYAARQKQCTKQFESRQRRWPQTRGLSFSSSSQSRQ